MQNICESKLGEGGVLSKELQETQLIDKISQDGVQILQFQHPVTEGSLHLKPAGVAQQDAASKQ